MRLTFSATLSTHAWKHSLSPGDTFVVRADAPTPSNDADEKSTTESQKMRMLGRVVEDALRRWGWGETIFELRVVCAREERCPQQADACWGEGESRTTAGVEERLSRVEGGRIGRLSSLSIDDGILIEWCWQAWRCSFFGLMVVSVTIMLDGVVVGISCPLPSRSELGEAWWCLLPSRAADVARPSVSSGESDSDLWQV